VWVLRVLTQWIGVLARTNRGRLEPAPANFSCLQPLQLPVLLLSSLPNIAVGSNLAGNRPRFHFSLLLFSVVVQHMWMRERSPSSFMLAVSCLADCASRRRVTFCRCRWEKGPGGGANQRPGSDFLCNLGESVTTCAVLYTEAECDHVRSSVVAKPSGFATRGPFTFVPAAPPSLGSTFEYGELARRCSVDGLSASSNLGAYDM
jgi:hypothetical protein